MNVFFILAILGASVSATAQHSIDNRIYRFAVTTIAGKTQSMAAYSGQVLLIVNTASSCGFTPQLKGLQQLHSKYKSQGFSVLGFPSPDFGGQEPRSNQEIKTFCELNYKIDFPLFAKISLKGPNKAPLFRYLTEAAGKEFNREIDWNFEKFIVNRRGNLVARFASAVDPTSKEITARIETALSEKGQ